MNVSAPLELKKQIGILNKRFYGTN